MADTDVRFYFDPVCPFAWLTSKWVRHVRRAAGLTTVDWRFISLRLINDQVDRTATSRRYEEGHTSGRGCCGSPRGPGRARPGAAG